MFEAGVTGYVTALLELGAAIRTNDAAAGRSAREKLHWNQRAWPMRFRQCLAVHTKLTCELIDVEVGTGSVSGCTRRGAVAALIVHARRAVAPWWAAYDTRPATPFVQASDDAACAHALKRITSLWEAQVAAFTLAASERFCNADTLRACLEQARELGSFLDMLRRNHVSATHDAMRTTAQSFTRVFARDIAKYANSSKPLACADLPPLEHPFAPTVHLAIADCPHMSLLLPSFAACVDAHRDGRADDAADHLEDVVEHCVEFAAELLGPEDTERFTFTELARQIFSDVYETTPTSTSGRDTPVRVEQVGGDMQRFASTYNFATKIVRRYGDATALSTQTLIAPMLEMHAAWAATFLATRPRRLEAYGAEFAKLMTATGAVIDAFESREKFTTHQMYEELWRYGPTVDTRAASLFNIVSGALLRVTLAPLFPRKATGPGASSLTRLGGFWNWIGAIYDDSPTEEDQAAYEARVVARQQEEQPPQPAAAAAGAPEAPAAAAAPEAPAAAPVHTHGTDDAPPLVQSLRQRRRTRRAERAALRKSRRVKRRVETTPTPAPAAVVFPPVGTGFTSKAAMKRARRIWHKPLPILEPTFALGGGNRKVTRLLHGAHATTAWDLPTQMWCGTENVYGASAYKSPQPQELTVLVLNVPSGGRGLAAGSAAELHVSQLNVECYTAYAAGSDDPITLLRLGVPSAERAAVAVDGDATFVVTIGDVSVSTTMHLAVLLARSKEGPVRYRAQASAVPGSTWIALDFHSVPVQMENTALVTLEAVWLM